MQITHEEAQRLIQFKSDSRLDPQREADLNEHLSACPACRGYSDELSEAENILIQAMHKKWDVHPLPLQLDALLDRVNPNEKISAIVSTRMVLLSFVFIFFVFVAWRSSANPALSSQVPISTLPLIPTPANQYTATNTLQNECSEIFYTTQKGDTLDILVQRFSTTKEALISANRLTSETLIPHQELVILFCGSTPTSTTYPPVFTITPIFEKTESTPG